MARIDFLFHVNLLFHASPLGDISLQWRHYTFNNIKKNTGLPFDSQNIIGQAHKILVHMYDKNLPETPVLSISEGLDVNNLDRVFIYNKYVKRPLKNRQNEDLNDKW